MVISNYEKWQVSLSVTFVFTYFAV